ncbi:hypothetical protein EJB05_39868 [Eragrostis curvula]|uniref:Factor of DNA methylation 1-5/IDN2 domain-containing protein n=1 Tax=Eragrostis curvula TaxID=38414 RepID=A0A5J9U010_9POAL|nr:hypothetical protein EJB05_39868 [Eragrostis curvula]
MKSNPSVAAAALPVHFRSSPVQARLPLPPRRHDRPVEHRPLLHCHFEGLVTVGWSCWQQIADRVLVVLSISPLKPKKRRKMAGDGSGTSDGLLGGHMNLLVAKVDSKISFHKDATTEYMELKNLIGEIIEEKARMEQEALGRVAAAPPEPVLEKLAMVREELEATKALLAARNKELGFTEKLLAANNEQVAASEELAAVTMVALRLANEGRDEDVNAIVTKVHELEAMKNQAEQQSLVGIANDSVQHQPSKRLAGHHASTDDELKRLRETLMKIDSSRRRALGVKVMGRLDEKPFHAACAAKLPPKEAKKATSEPYTTWEMLLKNPTWKPFKTDAVGDNCEDQAIDEDDEMLQVLKREWGEDVHDAVIRALMEMKEYNCLSNRSVSYELWNYKEGRKATMTECVEYMSNQVKLLSSSKRRKAHRDAGRA